MKKVLGIVAGIFLASSMWAEDVYAIFNAEAIKDANLNLATSGIVSDIFVDVGSEVKKGDLLLNLFNQDIFSQIQDKNSSSMP
ncbi:biotin/lipoyl-binding protein [Helicobacter typhlonius]|uniref:biotin/lipoyl-binding protein n=1 Tax=Helicobacter typhlonius TaxID=76936 RepID=UPI002FE12CD6